MVGGSGGIGSEVCRLLPSAGFTPIIGFNKGHKNAAELATECGGIAVKIDLSNNQSIIRSAEEIALFVQEKGSLEGVVLAASPPPDLFPFASSPSEALINQLQINVIGCHLLLAALIKKCFRKKKFGVVIGILTKALGTDLLLPEVGMSSYIIAKGAMKTMLSACAAEYPWLKVCTISPGFTKTQMLKVFDSRYLEMAEAQTPFLSSREVAQLIIGEILS